VSETSKVIMQKCIQSKSSHHVIYPNPKLKVIFLANVNLKMSKIQPF